MRNQDRF